MSVPLQYAFVTRFAGDSEHRLSLKGSAFEVFAMDAHHSTGPLYCLDKDVAEEWVLSISHNIRLLSNKAVLKSTLLRISMLVYSEIIKL